MYVYVGCDSRDVPELVRLVGSAVSDLGYSCSVVSRRESGFDGNSNFVALSISRRTVGDTIEAQIQEAFGK